MLPSSSAATRLALLGCLLAVASGLALSACGDDGAATAGGTTATPSEPQRKAAAGSGKPCPAKANAFFHSLDRLRRELAVGLSYEQYAAKVKGLRASYRAIPVDHLTIGCLASAGNPAERAFNKYIDASNDWGECLADASCSTATIEPILQRQWRAASRFLSR